MQVSLFLHQGLPGCSEVLEHSNALVYQRLFHTKKQMIKHTKMRPHAVVPRHWLAFQFSYREDSNPPSYHNTNTEAYTKVMGSVTFS